jgi:hypothetical protein
VQREEHQADLPRPVRAQVVEQCGQPTRARQSTEQLRDQVVADEDLAPPEHRGDREDLILERRVATREPRAHLLHELGG